MDRIFTRAVFVAHLATGLGSPAAQAEEKPRWILGNLEPESGEVFEAFLKIPADTNQQSEERTAEFEQGPGLSIWLRAAHESCYSAESRARHTAVVESIASSVLRVCARSNGRRTSALVATVRTRPKTGPSEVIDVVSDKFAVARGWQPGGVALLLLGAVVGFASGLAGDIWRLLAKGWHERRQAASEIEAALAKALVQELLENASALDQFLTRGGPAPSLPYAKLRTAISSGPALNLLDSRSLSWYQRKLVGVYEAQAAYQQRQQANRPDNDVKVSARNLQKELDSLTCETRRRARR